MSFIRPEIAALQPTGVAKAALDDGETFYSFTRGTLRLREGLERLLRY
ncbi:MAG: hypothetical protein O7F73_03730 [Gammaproteobacteria bacterium]|nr:hypothetical protein [Gammaproteobacteria bacterium]